MQNKPSNWLPDDVWMDSLAKQISSGAVICRFGERILVVKASYKDYWTFPGGVVDDGETPIQTAVRELKEETNLVVKASDLKFFNVVVADKINLKAYHFAFEIELNEEILNGLELQTEELEAYQLLSKEQILSGEHGLMSYSIITWAENKSGYQEYFDINNT